MVQILVMDGVLIALAILLIVAQRLLVTYGECKITVTQESGAKELLVQGGDYLISYLSANNIVVESQF